MPASTRRSPGASCRSSSIRRSPTPPVRPWRRTRRASRPSRPSRRRRPTSRPTCRRRATARPERPARTCGEAARAAARRTGYIRPCPRLRRRRGLPRLSTRPPAVALILEVPIRMSAALSPEQPSAAQPLVRFAGVQKTYDGVQLVVRQLDLDIRRGEFLTLLGPSGSGKTTTLMMLAGFESPTAGYILLDGRPITRTPPHRRNFGMVFQNYALFPHMTVGQNVAYPLTVRKVPAAARAAQVARALAMVRLEGMAERFPTQLSGGQQQRVALARALVFEPQLVLMDEPLGALDKQLREHMQIELKDLHRQLGVTFVYVTHDQGEALTMSDRVAVFNNGVIQQIDAADRMYETPANRFVAGFIGDGTMLDGVVTATEGAACTVGLASGSRVTGLNVN